MKNELAGDSKLAITSGSAAPAANASTSSADKEPAVKDDKKTKEVRHFDRRYERRNEADAYSIFYATG